MESFKLKKIEEAKMKDVKTTKFAGEEFIFEKELTEKERKLKEYKEKCQTHKGLDDIVEDISKKKEINIIDKTKVDWDKYVEQNKLDKELEYARKDGYLNKKRFIDTVNMNLLINKKEEEEKEKKLQQFKASSKKLI